MTRLFGLRAIRYPKSFLKLLLLGFTLAALPMILALWNATAYVNRLTSQSQAAVDLAVEQARESRALKERVTTLERLAREYLILKDPSLLADYVKVRKRFEHTTSALSLLPLDEMQLKNVNRTIDEEQALFENLNRGQLTETVRRQLAVGYVKLAASADKVLDRSRVLIDRQVAEMGAAARQMQRALEWQFAASLPLGVLIAALFTFLIAKPIHQIDQAIRQLGGAEFGPAIQVRGPADLEYLGARLDWLRRRLAELEEQKIKFLRHVSHELKTPLTAMREGTELLSDGSSGQLNPQQCEIVEILKESCLKLQHLIEGLLESQRALVAANTLALGRVDLSEIVRQVVEANRLVMASRRLSPVLHLEPAVMTADADKLKTVVDNLMSNAIKYSPEGGTIGLATRQEKDKIVFEVEDSGPGIAEEDRERIFEWFFQGRFAHQGRVKGSGLGLAIARELVLAHQGILELVPGRGPGAHFRMTLPISFHPTEYQL